MKHIIIGGVAGGATTAARLRRLDEKSQIIIFEKGAYISYANCGLPYYIGGTIPEREKLFLQTPEGFGKRFNLDVRVNTEVLSIEPMAKKIKVKNLINGDIYEETYDTLVLSPGAEPIKPPLPGIDLPGIFTLRNVADTDRIKTFVNENKPQHAIVVGGGFIGLEMAENLHKLGIQVSIVEMADQMMNTLDFSMASIVHQHLKSKNVEFYLKDGVSAFSTVNNQLEVTLRSGRKLNVDMVILSIGVRPDVKLAREAGLDIGITGGIRVNNYLQTSSPDIYAVGDAIEFKSPVTSKPVITYLAGPANRQGRICADNIVTGNTIDYKGSIGTAIAKVFDITVGSTGVSGKTLQKEDIPFLASTTHSASHAGYYPGAIPMSIKILFAPGSGKLLGAQIVGIDGVDKRLDLLATVIKSNGTIYDLIDIEHAYAPPYSSAKDPVNMAGYVAENILTGKVSPIYWREIKAIDANDSMLLDVRTPGEFKLGSIPGAVNIPVDELRNRLPELPLSKKIIIFCAVGLRGYIATRILSQNGFNRVSNLSGGYKTWEVAVK
jgi:NADPH-dependent 2,4-dienoyl-CoA reductase/sulfur reductase-like enzyme/rhodanese-related sulfurtransferase